MDFHFQQFARWCWCSDLHFENHRAGRRTTAYSICPYIFRLTPTCSCPNKLMYTPFHDAKFLFIPYCLRHLNKFITKAYASTLAHWRSYPLAVNTCHNTGSSHPVIFWACVSHLVSWFICVLSPSTGYGNIKDG